MTRGLFFAELDRFTFEKVASFKNMMGLFAAAHLAYSNRLSEMWSASLGSLGMDAHEAAKQAQQTLAELDALAGVQIAE